MELTSKQAKTIVKTIEAELEKRGKVAIIAVTDAHGDLLAFLRMDKSKLSSISAAINKAYTAARTQRTTSEVGRNARELQTGYDLAYYGDPRFTGFGGGVPVVVKQEVIGGVAVSGLSQAEDEEIAQLGINSLGL